MGGPPSTKLTVRSVVICTTLTEDIVGFTGEWAESCGYDRLGNFPIGKLHIWEVATWGKSFWKVPNIEKIKKWSEKVNEWKERQK